MAEVSVLPSLLQELRKKSGLYIGRESLSLLAAFLDGYCFAEGPEAAAIEKSLDGFQDWIASRYRIASPHRWSSIISFYEPIESDAFHRFFDLLEQFHASKTGGEQFD
jgi:hypothetical protein